MMKFQGGCIEEIRRPLNANEITNLACSRTVSYLQCRLSRTHSTYFVSHMIIKSETRYETGTCIFWMFDDTVQVVERRRGQRRPKYTTKCVYTYNVHIILPLEIGYVWHGRVWVKVIP